MKVWIDKQGGLHYHKESCEIPKGAIVSLSGKKIVKLPPIKFHYEEITHIIRHRKSPHRNVKFNEFAPILIENKVYYPCPICFGHGERK
jgi:hypothetical protein